jgi:hypothetical protein
MDKLPPDFHAVDTRPEGAKESDEYEATHSAASKLFDLRYLIGGLFTVYGLMLTIAGFFTSDADIAKAAGINIKPLARHLHVVARYLLPGLGEAQSTETARAELDRHRPANDAPLIRPSATAAATMSAAES